MKAGRIQDSSAYARRVSVLIERDKTKVNGHLQFVEPRFATNDLSKRVGEITKPRSDKKPCMNVSAAGESNQHYSKISKDLKYVSPLVKTTASTNSHIVMIVSEQEIFFLLDRLGPTSIGHDMWTSWFLRLTAPIYSNILGHIINQSIYEKHVQPNGKPP